MGKAAASGMSCDGHDGLVGIHWLARETSVSGSDLGRMRATWEIGGKGD